MNTVKKWILNRVDKVNVFEAENNLHFWKKSKAARVARMKWATQREIGNEVWEEKGVQVLFQATERNLYFILKIWWGCLDFPYALDLFGRIVFSLGFQVIESKVDTNTTLW